MSSLQNYLPSLYNKPATNLLQLTAYDDLFTSLCGHRFVERIDTYDFDTLETRTLYTHIYIHHARIPAVRRHLTHPRTSKNPPPSHHTHPFHRALDNHSITSSPPPTPPPSHTPNQLTTPTNPTFLPFLEDFLPHLLHTYTPQTSPTMVQRNITVAIIIIVLFLLLTMIGFAIYFLQRRLSMAGRRNGDDLVDDEDG